MTHERAEASASAVAADLEQLREDVAHMKDTLAELVRGEAGQARAAIRNAVNDAGSQVLKAASNAQDSDSRRRGGFRMQHRAESP